MSVVAEVVVAGIFDWFGCGTAEFLGAAAVAAGGDTVGIAAVAVSTAVVAVSTAAVAASAAAVAVGGTVAVVEILYCYYFLSLVFAPPG